MDRNGSQLEAESDEKEGGDRYLKTSSRVKWMTRDGKTSFFPEHMDPSRSMDWIVPYVSQAICAASCHYLPPCAQAGHDDED